jgi:hypothetical protein
MLEMSLRNTQIHVIKWLWDLRVFVFTVFVFTRAVLVGTVIRHMRVSVERHRILIIVVELEGRQTSLWFIEEQRITRIFWVKIPFERVRWPLWHL